MLEILAHTNIGKVPKHHKLIVIEIPDGLTVETVTQQALLGWDHCNQRASRAFGDAWINSRRSVALIVRSVIATHDRIWSSIRLPRFFWHRLHRTGKYVWDVRIF